MNNQNKTVEDLTRKGTTLLKVATAGAMKQIADDGTMKLGLTVGLIQGLKYNGNFKRGVKAGVVTVGVFGGINAVRNVAHNWDMIVES